MRPIPPYIVEQCSRVDNAVKEAVEKIDKSYLRKIQYEVHHCAANCCTDENASTDSIEKCINDCMSPLKTARECIQHEVIEFQLGLKNCVQHCHDDIKQSMSSTPSDIEMTRSTQKFETCAINCIDEHMDLIPQMMKTMQEVLKNGKKPNIDEAKNSK